MRILILALSVCLFTYTLSAQVGIATTVPSAQLELANNPLAPNFPLLELNPQTAPVGTATGQLAVIGNQLFMYDATRAKWLSTSATPLSWSKTGSASNENLRFGGDVANNNSGAAMPYNGTIVFVSAQSSGGNATKGFDVRVRSGSTTLSTTTFNLIANNFTNTSYNVDFVAGNYINVYAVPAGAAVTDPAVTVWVKWRK